MILIIIKTKAKLFASFRELLCEKIFETITVNEICKRSGVRRATFYNHFKDKYDFLAALSQELRRVFEEKIWAISEASPPSDYYIEYARGLVAFLDRHSDMVSMLLKSSVANSLISIIVDDNIKHTHARLIEDEKSGAVTLGAPANIVSVFLSAGIAHTVIRWLNDGKVMPTEEFTEYILATVKRFFLK